MAERNIRRKEAKNHRFDHEPLNFRMSWAERQVFMLRCIAKLRINADHSVPQAHTAEKLHNCYRFFFAALHRKQPFIGLAAKSPPLLKVLPPLCKYKITER
ncbi:hypothetical protein [Planktotalea arctica]|uniref:hypothetical protein n=2 Tax=Planktotalea arctica TaxID=1481893 RepID=UPI00321A2206